MMNMLRMRTSSSSEEECYCCNHISRFKKAKPRSRWLATTDRADSIDTSSSSSSKELPDEDASLDDVESIPEDDGATDGDWGVDSDPAADDDVASIPEDAMDVDSDPADVMDLDVVEAPPVDLDVPPAPIDWLPVEMMCHVASFLDPASIAALRQVSARWRDVVDSKSRVSVRPDDITPIINRSGDPLGVFHLTIESRRRRASTSITDPIASIVAPSKSKTLEATSTAVVNAPLPAIWSVTALEDGTNNDLLLRVLRGGFVRKLELINYGRESITWLPRLLPLHANLCELHIVLGRAGHKCVNPIVLAIGHQLRVMTVPNVASLGGADLPLLKTLSVCSQPERSLDFLYTVKHEPTARPGSIQLYYVVREYERRIRRVCNTYLPCAMRIIDAPRLTTVTIAYHKHASFVYRFALPIGLPYDQITDLTLIGAKLDSWTDLFTLPLPQIVRLTVRDVKVRYTYGSRDSGADYNLVADLRPRLGRPVLSSPLWSSVSIWCVSPNLRQLSIVQSPFRKRVSFPLCARVISVIYYAFPVLERLEFVECLPAAYRDVNVVEHAAAQVAPVQKQRVDGTVQRRRCTRPSEMQSRHVKQIRTLQRMCWRPPGERPATGVRHQTVIQFISTRSFAVSYMLQQDDSNHPVTLCNRCTHNLPLTEMEEYNVE